MATLKWYLSRNHKTYFTSLVIIYIEESVIFLYLINFKITKEEKNVNKCVYVIIINLFKINNNKKTSTTTYTYLIFSQQ